MEEKIIMWLATFGCAALFFGIGIYAEKLKKPMWFWAGSKVDPFEIADIQQYNKENGILWKWYSLGYAAAGIAEIWSTLVASAILVLVSTVGVIPLILAYRRIYNKYKVQ